LGLQRHRHPARVQVQRVDVVHGEVVGGAELHGGHVEAQSVLVHVVVDLRVVGGLGLGFGLLARNRLLHAAV